MKVEPDFGKLITETMGSDSFGQAAIKTQISKAYLVEMARGKVPSEKYVDMFADGYSMPLETRHKLRVLAGYDELSDPIERVEFALSGQDKLEDWQIEAIKRLAEQKRKKG
jgi:hypothetical protein